MTEANNPLYGMSKEEILYQLLQKEYGYYFSILEITRIENEKLSTHQPINDINPLLKKKKILLSCISEIEGALTPLKKHWQTKRDRTDPHSLKIKHELANLDRLLKEILELDLISQQILENYLEFLKEPDPHKALASPEKKTANGSGEKRS